jgi:hypothetical protein
MKAKWILVLFTLLLIAYLRFGCTGKGDGSDEGVPTHTAKAAVFIDTASTMVSWRAPL